MEDDSGGVSFTADAAELCVMNADGSNKHRLTHDQQFDFHPAWSPDGTAIAYIAEDGLYVISPRGGDARRVFEGRRTIVWDPPQWSPDGSRIAMAVCRAEDQGSDILILEPNGGQLVRLTSPTGATIDSPRWSPDGGRLAYRLASGPTCSLVLGGENPHELVIVDMGRAAPTTGILDTLPAVASQFVWQDDDTLVYSLYQGNTASDVYQIDLYSDTPELIKRDIGYLWALNGTLLAYEVWGSYKVLAVEDLSTGTVAAISESDFGALGVEWSPDGRWLLVDRTGVVPPESGGWLCGHSLVIQPRW